MLKRKRRTIGGIPRRLKAIRGRLGLSQTELAARIGVSFASVNRWENGACKPTMLAQRQIKKIEVLSAAGTS